MFDAPDWVARTVVVLLAIGLAYANKLARIAWSVIRTEKPFDLARAFR